MERLFDKTSLIKLLKDGLKKPNPANPKKKMWTLKQLDIPSSGWKNVVTECEGNPFFIPSFRVRTRDILSNIRSIILYLLNSYKTVY